METTIKKLPKSEIEILFEISEQEFNNYYQKALTELSKNFKKPGFRQGKVPKEITEKEIDENQILNEAADMAVRENYIQTISKEKIEPISQPEIEILKLVKGNPLEFKAKIQILPEIKLPDYKKIASQIKKIEISLEEKEIEESLKWIQKSRAKFTVKNQPAKKGDWVEISFKSLQIEQGKEFKDKFILGDARFVPGFEENLIAMSAGQEKEFSLVFPKDYLEKELANKEINFWTKMESVQEMELSELNDEFAKSLGKFENLVDLKKDIEKGIKQEKELKEKQKIHQEFLNKISDLSDFEIPEILIEREVAQMIEDLKQKISQDFKMGFEEYLSKANKKIEDLKTDFSIQAKQRVQNFLVLREIGKKENITVSEKEIEEKINETLKNSPDIDRDKLKMYYEDVIRNEKIFKKIESFSNLKL